MEQLRKKYDEMEHLESCKNLKILKDNLGAHFDYKFIKKENFADVDFTNANAIEIGYYVLHILSNIYNMIPNNNDLVSLIPFSSDGYAKTCIDNIF